MAVSGVNLTAGLGAPTGSQATGSTSPTSSKDASNNPLALSNVNFFNLLLAQLQNQDPLNPTSSDSFLTQTSQFATVQGINGLNTSITQLLSSQQLSQGAALIGKAVTYSKAGASGPQSGTVSAVNVVNGQVQLAVGSDSVSLAQVQSIKAA